MGGTSYQMATTSHTRTSIVVSYKECCLHQNISLPPSRLLWQWSTERISGQQFQHIHRTHMYRHRECSQFVSPERISGQQFEHIHKRKWHAPSFTAWKPQTYKKKSTAGHPTYCHYATLNEKIVLWRLCITVKMAKLVCSKIVHLWLQIRFAKTVG